MVGRYSDAHQGLDIEANAGAILEIARALKTLGRHEFIFAHWVPSDQHSHAGTRLVVNVGQAKERRVSITREDSDFVLAGGARAAGMLAESLENLAALTPTGPPLILRHIDLEPYEGGEMLEPTGYGMTISLTEPAGAPTPEMDSSTKEEPKNGRSHG